MSNDTLLPFDLPSVRRKKLTIDFAGGNQSSDGGLLLLREAERKLGVCRRLAEAMPDRRDPDRVRHAIDAFVFTAGIGENSPAIRARIAEKLAWLGAVFNPEANANGIPQISRPESRVALLVVPTDEELMIAQHTVTLLRERRAGRATGERLAG
jgi:Acetokinase family/Transposase DDE domain group 1